MRTFLIAALAGTVAACATSGSATLEPAATVDGGLATDPVVVATASADPATPTPEAAGPSASAASGGQPPLGWSLERVNAGAKATLRPDEVRWLEFWCDPDPSPSASVSFSRDSAERPKVETTATLYLDGGQGTEVPALVVGYAVIFGSGWTYEYLPATDVVGIIRRIRDASSLVIRETPDTEPQPPIDLTGGGGVLDEFLTYCPKG